jgi:hypothetical protein
MSSRRARPRTDIGLTTGGTENAERVKTEVPLRAPQISALEAWSIVAFATLLLFAAPVLSPRRSRRPTPWIMLAAGNGVRAGNQSVFICVRLRLRRFDCGLRGRAVVQSRIQGPG